MEIQATDDDFKVFFDSNPNLKMALENIVLHRKLKEQSEASQTAKPDNKKP